MITSGYDELKEPIHNNPEWDFICFTDDESLSSDRWQIVLLENPSKLNAHFLSRRPKILPHLYLPEYEYTLYIDAAYRVTGDLNDLVDFENPISLVIRDLNRSIEDEVADLLKYKTIIKDEAERLISYLRADNSELSKGTYYMGGLIGRKQTDQIAKMMEEWWWLITHVFHRDQPWLQYLLHNYKITPGEYSTRWVRNYMSYHFHNKKTLFDPDENPNVFYFTPGDPHKKIGKTYNAHCEGVPNNEDWICVRDGDTAFLTSNWSEIISETIKRYPDTALFGCYTNRIGLDYQLTPEEGFSENLDMRHHARVAKERWEKYGTECETIDKPVAGMFMVFRRSVWTRVPFKDELVINNKFFDWDFGERIIKLGGTVRLMKGLYLFHGYRMLNGRQDKSHLMS